MLKLFRSSRLRASTSALALTAAALTAPQTAWTAACLWNGGSGDWSSAPSWSCDAIPGSGDAVTITDAGSTVSITNEAESEGSLDLGTGNALNLRNGTLFEAGDVTNDGVISVAGTSAGFSRLQNSVGTVNFTGTGTIILGNSVNAAQIYGAGGTVSFGSGQT